MSEQESLIEALWNLDPKFTFAPKSSRWFTRLHGRFFPRAAIILGHTCYYPEKEMAKEPSLYMAQLIAHEGMHLAQVRDLGKWHWYTSYFYPQWLGMLLALAGVLVGVLFGIFIDASWGIVVSLGWLFPAIYFLLAREKARDRAVLELEAYGTLPIVLNLDLTCYGDVWERFVDRIYAELKSSNYLGCGESLPRNYASMYLWRAATGTMTLGQIRPGRPRSEAWAKTLQRIFLDAPQKSL
jgi:hypothetical protein